MRFRFYSKPVLALLIVLSVGIGSAVGLVMTYVNDLPHVDKLQEFQPDIITRILSHDGQLVGELYERKRILVSLADVPTPLLHGIVSAEDSEFFDHTGIDYWGILRAVWADLRAMKKVQGASTITQQLARLLFLTPDKHLTRKVKEAFLAMLIEKRFTKNEILELYLNQIYLGAGAYGVEAAARIYFGKPVKELDLAESALIAGLPKAPNRYSPYHNPERARLRRATVLQRMKSEGYISAAEEQWANDQPIRVRDRYEGDSVAPYFVEYVRLYLEDRYGSAKMYNDGLTVETSLNLDWQKIANRAVQNGVNTLNERISKRKRKTEPEDPKGGAQPESIQVSLISLDPQTGLIRAMVGGTDFSKTQFNRTYQAQRQPGSAFKPFIYITALEKGYSPSDRLIDSPVAFPDPSKPGDWKPTNFSEKFYGPISLRFALEHSVNVASVKLLHKIGVQNVADTAVRMGILSPLKPFLSLALGVSEVNLLELTSAYGILANQGIHQEPAMILAVRDRDGRVLETHNLNPVDVLKPDTAFIATQLLQGVVARGTGRVAQEVGRPVAAKTGTTDKYHDAWFVGFSPELVTGVWVGFDSKFSMGREETGGRAAGPIWTEYMKEVLAGLPYSDFKKPENIVEVQIDADSGFLATEKCKNVITEYYIEGTQPHKLCPLETQRPTPDLL
jgi:penicillin-binding protein 1A